MSRSLPFVLVSFIFCISSFDASGSGSGSASSSRGGRMSRSEYYTKNNDGYSRYVDDKDRRDGGDKFDYIEKLLIAVLKENIVLSSRIDGLSSRIDDSSSGIEELKKGLEEVMIEIGDNIEDITGLMDNMDDLAEPIIAPSIEVIRTICVGGLRGVSGDLDNPNRDDVTCTSGSRINPGDDDPNDLGAAFTLDSMFTSSDAFDIEDCETLCRDTPGCVAFNWFISENQQGITRFGCEVYNSAVPMNAATAEDDNFDPDVIVFCVLDDLPCIKGEIITYAGSADTLPDYLVPANGHQVSDDDYPGICGILGTLYGTTGYDDTCLLPNLEGKSLLYGTTSECQSLFDPQPACVVEE